MSAMQLSDQLCNILWVTTRWNQLSNCNVHFGLVHSLNGRQKCIGLIVLVFVNRKTLFLTDCATESLTTLITQRLTNWLYCTSTSRHCDWLIDCAAESLLTLITQQLTVLVLVGTVIDWLIVQCYWLHVWLDICFVMTGALRRVHTGKFLFESCCHEQFSMKKTLRETQTLRAGCSKTDPKIFAPPQTPFPRDAWRPNFNQLEMVTTFNCKPSLVKMDARNFKLSW